MSWISRNQLLYSLLILLILLLALAGCADKAATASGLRVVELEAENSRLLEQLTVVNDALTGFQKVQNGLFSQQIVAKEVTFHQGEETLQAVRGRNVLRCGGNADLPGLGYLDPDSGEFIGFDTDFCRAIAAATLGPQGADKIEITPLTAKLRFASLQRGDIDVLIRNTTWTMSRDTELRTNFTGVTFYDGQGIMVRTDGGIRKLSELRNKTFCVQEGSTSASNIADHFANIGVSVELRAFRDRLAARNQYEDGACDAYTGDKSSLIAEQTLMEEPTAHKILVEDISREPLGPVVRHDDDNWRDIVAWSVQCIVNAEFLGVSQENVDEMLASSQALSVRRLLGIEGELGKKMGLSNDFCYQIIRQVGNYADIYNRHLGDDTPFKLSRGLNALYGDGGLHYPLPFK